MAGVASMELGGSFVAEEFSATSGNWECPPKRRDVRMAKGYQDTGGRANCWGIFDLRFAIGEGMKTRTGEIAEVLGGAELEPKRRQR